MFNSDDLFPRLWDVFKNNLALVIQEVTEAWAAELEAQTSYPHRHVVSREDPYGLALLSRWPMESVTLVDLAGDELPSFAGIVDAVIFHQAALGVVAPALLGLLVVYTGRFAASWLAAMRSPSENQAR